MTRKTAFFEWWSWFKGLALALTLALGTNLKLYNSVAKRLKLKIRKFWGLVLTFGEVAEKTLVGEGGLWPPPPLPLPLSWTGLSNIEITKYFNYGPRFTGDFSRDNLARIKFEAYVINLDDKQSKETHWISLFIDENAAIYFDSFGIEYIPKELLSKIKDRLQEKLRLYQFNFNKWL